MLVVDGHDHCAFVANPAERHRQPDNHLICGELVEPEIELGLVDKLLVPLIPGSLLLRPVLPAEVTDCKDAGTAGDCERVLLAGLRRGWCRAV